MQIFIIHHQTVLPKTMPRVPLAFLPTPVHELPNLRQALGANCPRLLIKRDDQTGLATGGNKTRKLEFVIADAIAQGADTVITTGSAQSNHCRQTAAAAAIYGLKCILVLRGYRPDTVNGNLLLDELLGAEIRWTEDIERSAIPDLMQAIADDVQANGGKPYVIPLGASTPIGAAGYIAAIEELAMQLEGNADKVDRIVIVSGSGGTHAGMLLGVKLHNLPIVVEGMMNSGFDTLPQTLTSLTNATIAHFGFDISLTDADYCLSQDAGTHAYGVVTEGEREALRLLARHEGIIADPVYTGRGLAGLINRVRKGVYDRDETVLFWHTGGTAGLFAKADSLVD